MESENLYDRVAQRWRERGVVLLPPARDADVVRTFDQLGYPLSADVRRLYTTFGGFEDFGVDGLWSFWSLSRLCKENDDRSRHRRRNKGEPRAFVMFADYLISSHVYCFHYERADNSSVYISHDGESLERAPVASSVGDFFEKLINKPDDVEAWYLEV